MANPPRPSPVLPLGPGPTGCPGQETADGHFLAAFCVLRPAPQLHTEAVTSPLVATRGHTSHTVPRDMTTFAQPRSCAWPLSPQQRAHLATEPSPESHFTDAEVPAASCEMAAPPTGSPLAAHREASPHHQHTETARLHGQRQSHSLARPFRSVLDQGTQNHALLKPSFKHSPTLHLSTVDKQHLSPRPWQRQAQHLPSSSEHPNGCHVPRGATTLQAKRQDCAASNSGGTPGISPGSCASVSQLGLQLLSTQPSS